jgi:phosphate binding protein
MHLPFDDDHVPVAGVARPVRSFTASVTARRLGWIAVGAAGAGVVCAAVLIAVPAPRPRPLPAASAGVTPKPRTSAVRAPVDAARLTGPGDAPPALRSAAPPEKPAVDLALAPTVVLRLLVDETGAVREARVYRSRLELAAFEDAAIEAARGFRFEPARQAGQPVAAWINWPVSFAQATPPAPRAHLAMKGSDTIGATLGPDLARAFAARRPEIDVTVECLGTATGFVGLLDGTADVAAASRPVNAKELAEAARLGVTFTELVIGYDGIAVVVHPKNPVGALTVEQAARVFTGEITRWSELGGPDRPIRRLSRPSYSGTHAFFRDKVLRRGDAGAAPTFAPGTEWIEESARLVEFVGADPDAIGYVGMGHVTPAVKALGLAPGEGAAAVTPSADSVRDGSYPVYRPLLLYTRGAPVGPLAAFVRFVLSAEGQALVEKHGFIRGDVHAEALVPASAETAPAPEGRAPAPAARIGFRARSARVAATDAHTIGELARAVVGSDRGVLVIGHADGDAEANERMARRRAENVGALLCEAGVPAERIRVESAGSDAPVASNATDGGRDRNRRVDVYLVKKW